MLINLIFTRVNSYFWQEFEELIRETLQYLCQGMRILNETEAVPKVTDFTFSSGPSADRLDPRQSGKDFLSYNFDQKRQQPVVRSEILFRISLGRFVQETRDLCLEPGRSKEVSGSISSLSISRKTNLIFNYTVAVNSWAACRLASVMSFEK